MLYSALMHWDYVIVFTLVFISLLYVPSTALQYGNKNKVFKVIIVTSLMPIFLPIGLIISSKHIPQTKPYILSFLAFIFLSIALIAFHYIPSNMSTLELTEDKINLRGDTPHLILDQHIREYSNASSVTTMFNVGTTKHKYTSYYYRIQPVNKSSNEKITIFSFESDRQWKSIQKIDSKYDVFHGHVSYRKNINEAVINALQKKYPNVNMQTAIFLRSTKKESISTQLFFILVFFSLSILFFVKMFKSYKEHFVKKP